MSRSFVSPVVLFLALAVGGSVSVHAQPAKNTPSRVSLDMTILEATGAPIAERKVEATVGTTEAVVVKDKDRTITVDTTVNPGTKPGCFRVDLVVRDRTIGASLRFDKAVWRSGTEPCDSQPITLGPKEAVRVRIAVKSLPPNRR